MSDEDLLLKYVPWSISKAQIALTCPKQFALKYVDKQKEIVPRSENRVGIVSHEILEKRLLGKPLKDSKKEAVEKLPLTTPEEEKLTAVLDSIELFIKKFDGFCKSNGVTKVLVEEKWGVDISLSPVSFFAKNVFFRGVVDLAAITKDGDLIVVDHKSGSVKPVEKYRPQLQSYAVLGLANYSNIAGMQGAVHHLQGNESNALQWAEYIHSDEIKKRINAWLITYLSSAAEELKDLELTKPKEGWPCSWCPYSVICDPYQKLLNVKKE